MTNGLTLRNVDIALAGKTLVQVDHHIKRGEVLTVMGPSGVGKSTLLSYITGTLAAGFAASGDVVLNRRPITELPPQARRVGILFQDDLLFPHLSVGANLAFGLRPGGSRRARAAQVEDALSDVGLTGFANRDPATLSGGQKARVSLMRMLLSEPEALLLDEPFSRLDTALRSQIRDMVFSRARQRNLPVLMVTHDQQDADAANGTIIHLGPTRTPA